VTATFASVKTEQRTTVKFEGAIGRVVGLFGGDAATDGLVTTTVVENDRMYTSSDDRRAESIDLAEGRMYDLDLRDKTYEVTTFDELRARIQEMQERACERAPFDASSRQPPETASRGGRLRLPWTCSDQVRTARSMGARPSSWSPP